MITRLALHLTPPSVPELEKFTRRAEDNAEELKIAMIIFGLSVYLGNIGFRKLWGFFSSQYLCIQFAPIDKSLVSLISSLPNMSLDSLYDIVFCISGTALQDQIRFFYKNINLPGQPVAGYGKPKKPVKKLIDHDLNLVSKEVGSKLEAHIDCPEIILQDNQSARIKLTLIRDESAKEAKKKDSVINFMKNGTEVIKIVNGAEVSWKASIASRPITSIMNDLIKPARDDNHKATLSETTADQLNELEVDDREFLASSVFCLFEASTVTSSLEVIIDGKHIAEDDDIFRAFKSLILQYTDSFDKNPVAPSEKAPFVLGYGISQTPESMKKASGNPAGSEKKPPTAFVPKNFQIITAGKTEKNPTGVLAYGITTYAEEIAADQKKPEKFITVRQAMDRIPKSYNGILAISPRLLMDELVIKSLMPMLQFDPEPIGQTRSAYNLGVQNKENIEIRNGPVYYQSGYKWVSHKNDDPWIGKIDYWFEGATQVAGSLWSQAAHAEEHGYKLADDANHTTIITLRPFQHYRIEEKGWGLGWSTKLQSNLLLSYELKLAINSAQGGALSFEILQNDSKLPKVSNGTGLEMTRVKSLPLPDAFSTTGAFYYEHNYNFTSSETGYVPEDRLPSFTAFTSEQLEAVAKAVTNGLGDLRKLVVMPAGHVFGFNGVDSDLRGGCFSRVSYATITTGVQV